jgi:hypothetical protein
MVDLRSNATDRCERDLQPVERTEVLMEDSLLGMKDSPLVLGYSFITDPLTIYASTANQTSTIDLTVMISAPPENSVTVQSLSITIPMGEDVAGDLSTGSLPPPSCTDPNWSIQTSGGAFVITPVDPKKNNQIGADSLLVQFKQIAINDQPGQVDISIVECVNSAPANNNDTRYTLTKQVPATPATNLAATPASITAQKTSTITWQTDSSGNYDFAIEITGPDGHVWSSCKPGVPCLDAKNGVDGVTTPVLAGAETYTITLNVYQNGSVLPNSPTTTLSVIAPKIYPNACSLTSHLGGYRYSFRWATINATRCALYQAGGDLLIDNVPLNTDATGYIVWRQSTWPTTLNFELRAYDAAGNVAIFPYDPATPAFTTYTPTSTPNTGWKIPLAGSIDNKSFFAGFAPKPVLISIADPLNASVVGSTDALMLNDIAVDPKTGVAYLYGCISTNNINYATVWTMPPDSSTQIWNKCVLGQGIGTSISIDIDGGYAYAASLYWVLPKITLGGSEPSVTNLNLQTDEIAPNAVAALDDEVTFVQDNTTLYVLSGASTTKTFPNPWEAEYPETFKLVYNDPSITLYTLVYNPPALKRIDGVSGTVTLLPLPDFSGGFDIAGNYAYITMQLPHEIRIVDLEKFALLPITIPLSDQAMDIAVTSDGQNLAVRIGTMMTEPTIVIFPALDIQTPARETA